MKRIGQWALRVWRVEEDHVPARDAWVLFGILVLFLLACVVTQ